MDTMHSDLTESLNSKMNDLSGQAAEMKEKLARTARRARVQAEELSRHTQRNVNRAVRYVRGHSMEEIVSEAESYVGEHPGVSLVAAAALGFLVGRTFRGED